MITDGVRTLFQDAAFHWLLLMASLYILGTLLYATRTPERFFPGKCDILACFPSIIDQIQKFLLLKLELKISWCWDNLFTFLWIELKQKTV